MAAILKSKMATGSSNLPNCFHAIKKSKLETNLPLYQISHSDPEVQCSFINIPHYKTIAKTDIR